MTARPSIAFISREVWPFVQGGGLGRSVWAAARLLAGEADVTIVTSERHRAPHRELSAAADPRLPDGVRFAFAPEPDDDVTPYLSWLHAWSASLFDTLVELYPDGGPDVIEAPDYQGDGFVVAHALRAGDARLRRSVLAVRLHTSAEICALLDGRRDDVHLELLRGIERFPLAFADKLLEPGGDVIERYRRHYGEDNLAPALRCPPPLTREMMPAAHPEPPPAVDGQLRVLYLNRLQRLKGIEDLLGAVAGLDSRELRLTVVGGDTDTGPGETSMRAYAERIAGDDPRVRFADRVPYDEIGALIADHHLVVVPSRWEAYSYVVREALASNRPVLATPVGPIPEVVEPGRSGWLAASPSEAGLRAAFEDLLGRRDEIDRMIGDGLPRRAFEADTNDELIAGVYRELFELAARRRSGRGGRPVAPTAVTAIIAAEASGASLEPTLRSLAGQRGAAVEVTVVGPPAKPSQLALMTELLEVPDDFDRVARWLTGARRAAGDLLLLVAAGTELRPDFVSEAAAALAAAPAFAYATALVAAGRDPWHAPAGNFAMPGELDLGASVALIRRSTMAAVLGDEAPPRNEAELFERLAEAGHFGLVLQKPLVRRLPRRSGVGLVV